MLVIESAANLWGSERALLDLLDGVSELEMAVCCPPDRPLQGKLEERHIRVFSYLVYDLHQKSKWHRLWAAIGVFRACLRFRPHVLYLNQSGSYRIVLPSAILLRRPIVAHVRIFEDAAYLARQGPSPRRLRCLIAISAAIEGEIRRFPGLETIPLQRLYDGYAPSPEPASSADKVSNRIACVGRLTAVKGQDVLVRALGALESCDGEVECLMIGDGEVSFIREMKQLASNGRSSSAIRWLGFVDDVLALLRTCSVLVCPSHREPLGRVILEAWDAGVVPVVYSGSGGAAEIVRAADGGILYDEQTPTCLAAALRQGLGLSPPEARSLVDNGRSWMTRHCDPESYGKAVSAIVMGACAPRRPSRSE